MALTKVTSSMTSRVALNVTDFGAVGDGSTDDTAAINAALATLGTNDIVFNGAFAISSPLTIANNKNGKITFTNGSYVIATAAMDEMFKFSGDATSETTSYGTATTFYPVEDFEFSGGVLNCNGNANIGIAIDTPMLNCLFSRNHVYYPKTHGIYVSDTDCHETKIIENKFTAGIAPYTHPGYPFTYGGTFYPCTMIESASNDTEIIGNVIRSGQNGIVVSGEATLIADNHIFRCKSYGLLVEGEGNWITTINGNYFDMNEVADIYIDNRSGTNVGRCVIGNNIFLQDAGAYMYNLSADPYYIYVTSDTASTKITGLSIINNLFKGSRDADHRFKYNANCSLGENTYIFGNSQNFVADVVYPYASYEFTFTGKTNSNTLSALNGGSASVPAIRIGESSGDVVGFIYDSTAEILQAVHKGVLNARFGADRFTPHDDNLTYLGDATHRWSTVYAGTGTINTSDAREKTFLAIDDAEKAAALEIKANLRKFKFNDAIAMKGEDARIHFGASAQQVGEIMRSHGLDPVNYGFWCYDVWEATEDQPAGDRYGLRYEELLAFIVGAI